MSELNKIRQISCIYNTGAINFEDSLQFNEGDKNCAFIHLRGTMDNWIKAQLKVKTPTGEVVLINSKTLNLKNVCREFALIIGEPGVYEAQLILSYKDQINNSNVFKYEVLKGIEGGI